MRSSPHPVTLRQLQYVVAVAELRSFRGAAQACRVSQASLSAQIAQVEQLLGAPLFDRDRRRVLLTGAGRDLVVRARALLIAADDLVDTAQSFADPFQGELRIGILPTLAPYLLPDLAPALRARYPQLTPLWLEDKTDALTVRLDAADLDAALVALVPELARYEHAVIGRDEFVLATSRTHALAHSDRAVHAVELAAQPMFLLDEGHCFRDQTLAFCARAGTEESTFRATSLTTLAQMVAAGAGCTLLPSIAVRTETQRAKLHVRPIAAPAPSRTIVLVWRKGASDAGRLRRIAQALREAYDRTRAKRTKG